MPIIGVFIGAAKRKGVDVCQKENGYIFLAGNDQENQEYREDNCFSKTEFIENAVKFYIGYLRQQEDVNYLSAMITETVKSQIKGTEQQLARLTFKMVVELGKLSHMTAAIK